MREPTAGVHRTIVMPAGCFVEARPRRRPGTQRPYGDLGPAGQVRTGSGCVGAAAV
ncbi:hypothetical protein ACRAWF_20085 [Streptomyces sp. L7]